MAKLGHFNFVRLDAIWNAAIIASPFWDFPVAIIAIVSVV